MLLSHSEFPHFPNSQFSTSNCWHLSGLRNQNKAVRNRVSSLFLQLIHNKKSEMYAYTKHLLNALQVWIFSLLELFFRTTIAYRCKIFFKGSFDNISTRIPITAFRVSALSLWCNWFVSWHGHRPRSNCFPWGIRRSTIYLHQMHELIRLVDAFEAVGCTA